MDRKRATERAGEVEAVGPVVAQFGNQGLDHAVDEPALTLGGLPPAKRGQQLSEEAFEDWAIAA